MSADPQDDPHLAKRQLAADVADARALEPKELPTKLFYDKSGSLLFEQITELKEYYLTRCEREIMHNHSAEMAEMMGPMPLILEYGSGSSLKTRLLLAELEPPATYLPVDISGEFLDKEARKLRREYPELQIMPLTADFTADFNLPRKLPRHKRRIAYCPGSTIGNQKGPQTVKMLQRMARQVGPNGYALLGIDMVKPKEPLEKAYNDAAGITARFNLNILRHINSRLDADFNVGNFSHRAYYDEEQACIVMKLVCNQASEVAVNGRTFSFSQGEEVITERSHKYTRDSFEALAEQAGLKTVKHWTDRSNWFGVHLLAHR